MSDEKNNDSLLSKAGKAIKKWFIGSCKYIGIGIAAFLSFVVFKKADSFIQHKDNDKKEKAKEASEDLKETVKDIEKDVKQIDKTTNKIIDDLSDTKKTFEKSSTDYKEKQVKTAEKVGFTKQ